MRGIGLATIVLATALLAGSAHGAGGASGERRVALVIGNSAYATSPLVNPVNDARLMASALRDNGFDVIEALDVNQIEMKLAITTFGERLDAAQGNAVGLFYYAGHGVQVGGVNYLIPIGAPIEKESHVSIYAVSANDVLATVEYARNNLNIVVLDACRNNPFVRSFRNSARGLAQMNAVTGTLIAYSTAPGQVALDGDGNNSPYTAALAMAIREPGVPVERVFKNVRDAVLESTHGRQTPWEASSLTGPDFYIVPPAQAAVVTTPPPVVVTPPIDPGISASERAALERTFWESVQDSDDATLFQAYIDQYPNGVFVVIARRRLEALAGTDIAIVVPPVVEPNRGPAFEVETLDSLLFALKSANVRAGPATEYDKVDRLSEGAEITVTGKVVGRDWFRIALPQGGDGYVWAPLLGENMPGQDAALHGAMVLEAERQLARLGYDPGPVDGTITNRTSQAVRTLQRDQGWQVDSVISARLVQRMSGLSPTTIAAVVPPPLPKTSLDVGGGDRDFGTIQAAINAAEPGDTVHVYPGSYREVIEIDKNVRVLGVGDRSQILLRQVPGEAIVWFGGGNGMIANMSIGEVRGDHHAIDVSAGAPTIENVDVSGMDYPLIRIRDGANPSVLRNSIHGAETNGIMVLDGGRGRIEDNDIFDLGFVSVWITGNSDPMVRNNRIFDGRQDGILVQENAAGTIEGNQIYDNLQAGVTTQSGGRPRVIGNTITGNGYQAIWIQAGGRGRFENNDLRGNASGAWFIETDAGTIQNINNIE